MKAGKQNLTAVQMQAMMQKDIHTAKMLKAVQLQGAVHFQKAICRKRG